MGPGIVTASLDEVLEAIARLPEDLAWPDVSDKVIPLFERLRPYPAETPEPLCAIVPPGLSISFAIDAGPAHLGISLPMLQSWGIDVGEVTAQALTNVSRRADAMSMSDLHFGSINGVPVDILQSGTGSASTFVLVPDTLPRIFGAASRTYIAPMRDLLVGLPHDVDDEFAMWLFDELAAPDPNCLAPRAFHFADGVIRAAPLGRGPVEIHVSHVIPSRPWET